MTPSTIGEARAWERIDKLGIGPLLTLDQMGDFLDCDRSRATWIVEAGLIPGVGRNGQQWVIPTGAVVNWSLGWAGAPVIAERIVEVAQVPVMIRRTG